MLLRISLAAATLCCSVSAQIFTDRFSVPSLPNIPVLGWTIETGVWKVANGRLSTDGARTWSYITKDNMTAKNCVLDAEMFYATGGVQFAGLTARYTSANNTLMCKIQQNSTASGGFDRAFLYERGVGGNTYANTTTRPTSAYCRMIVIENQFWMQMDLDKDGVYDQTVGPRAITMANGSAKLGLNAYSVSQIDNFEYFDAVLHPQANAVPKIGTTYSMDLYTTATKITPWKMALSLGNTGFPFGPYRIPLDVDAVFNLSLTLGGALGLAGVTDATGKATPGLVIPNDKALIGFGVYGAAIAIDGSKVMGIGGISNELYIKFQ